MYIILVNTFPKLSFLDFNDGFYYLKEYKSLVFNFPFLDGHGEIFKGKGHNVSNVFLNISRKICKSA